MRLIEQAKTICEQRIYLDEAKELYSLISSKWLHVSLICHNEAHLYPRNLASHPAARGSILGVPKNLSQCFLDSSTTSVRGKWTDAWKCLLNLLARGKLLLQKNAVSQKGLKQIKRQLNIIRTKHCFAQHGSLLGALICSEIRGKSSTSTTRGNLRIVINILCNLCQFMLLKKATNLSTSYRTIIYTNSSSDSIKELLVQRSKIKKNKNIMHI